MRNEYIAKLSLNSTQLTSTSIKAEVSFISTLIQPPTQPPGTEDLTHDKFKTIQDNLKDASRLLNNYSKTN